MRQEQGILAALQRDLLPLAREGGSPPPPPGASACLLICASATRAVAPATIFAGVVLLASLRRWTFLPTTYLTKIPCL